MNSPWEEPPVQYGYQPPYSGQPPRGNSSVAIAVIAVCMTVSLFCCCGGMMLVPLSLTRMHVPAPARAPQVPRPAPVRARQIPARPQRPPTVFPPKNLPFSENNDIADFKDRQKQLQDMQNRSRDRIEQMRKDMDQRRKESAERHEQMMRDMRQRMPRPPGELLPERP